MEKVISYESALYTTVDEVLNGEIISFDCKVKPLSVEQVDAIKADAATLLEVEKPDNLQELKEKTKSLLNGGQIIAPEKMGVQWQILEVINKYGGELNFYPHRFAAGFRSPTTAGLILDFKTYKLLLELKRARVKLEREIRKILNIQRGKAGEKENENKI